MSNEHNDYLARQVLLHKTLAKVYSEQRYRPKFSQVFQRHWNKTLVKAAGAARGALVLDYGSGTGILYQDLVRSGYRVVGIDLSHEMLSVEDPNEEVMRVCGDGTRLPFDDTTFDAVFCRGSIHHFPNVQLAFEEIGRVLKASGNLIFSEPSNDSVINRLARKWMYMLSDEFEEEDEGFHRAEIEPMLRNLSYEIEVSRGFGFFAYTLSGFPDKLNILSYVPGAIFATKIMIALDNFLERIPLVEKLALHWLVRARKK